MFSFLPLDDISAPKTVKVWKNTPNMDFADAQDTKPTQQFELSAKDLEGNVQLDLDYLKFKNVDNLTVRSPLWSLIDV